MAKDTFYFSHDYNSRNDEKIKFLIRRHGMLGYGIFWAIIEDLYNNANALRNDYEGIAYDFRVDTEIIKSIITDFDLFVFDNNTFGSLSVQKRLDERDSKSIKARQSASKRWDNANAMQTQSNSNAIKERKVKEIKVKETKVKVNRQTLFSETEFIDKEIFKAAFIGTQYEEANFEYYHEVIKNWSDSKGERKLNWIATAKNWMARDLKEGKFVHINYKPNAAAISNNSKLSYTEREAIAFRNL
jgi:hypothetical protein